MSTPAEHIKHSDDHDAHSEHQLHGMLEVIENIHEHIKYANCEPSQKVEEQIKLMYAGVGAVIGGVGATAVTPVVRLIPLVGDHLANGLIGGGAIVGAAKGAEIAERHIADHNLECTDKTAFEAKMAAERAADTEQFKEVLHNVGALVLGTELEKKAQAQQEANVASKPVSPVTFSPSATAAANPTVPAVNPVGPLRPRKVLTPEQKAIRAARVLESVNRIQAQQREAAAISARTLSPAFVTAPPAPPPAPAPVASATPTVGVQVTHNSVYVGVTIGKGGPANLNAAFTNRYGAGRMMNHGRW